MGFGIKGRGGGAQEEDGPPELSRGEFFGGDVAGGEKGKKGVRCEAQRVDESTTAGIHRKKDIYKVFFQDLGV